MKRVATPLFLHQPPPPFQVYPPFLGKISYPPHKWLKFWKVLPPNPHFNEGVGGSNYDLVLPYFLTISHTICQIKSFSLHFFSHLKGSIPLFTIKINCCGTGLITMALQAKLLSHCFSKSYSMVMKLLKMLFQFCIL